MRAAAFLALLFTCSCGGPPGPTPLPAAPVVSSITPSTGPTSGGTPVRITGANFTAGAAVTIGGVAASEVVVESATSIAARTGTRTAEGPADVTVTSGGRSGTLPAAFTYVVPTSTPPVIIAIHVRGTKFPNQPANFADAGDVVDVIVVVEDPDTPQNQLTFDWTAQGGTLTGNNPTGPSVKWHAPSQVERPTTVKVTVVVSDLPTQRVSGEATISLHNSTKEVGDLARQFLQDFSDSRIGASQVVREFSTSERCRRERDDEFEQVAANRVNYEIKGYSLGDIKVNFAFGGTPCVYQPRAGDACAAVPVVWDSMRLKDVDDGKAGQPGHTEGTDYITAVYEQSQWRLCASYFESRISTLAPMPTFIR